MTIRFSRKKLLFSCLALVGILSILQAISGFLYFNFDNAFVDEYVCFFDFGIEENLPTYCSAILLLMASITMVLCGLTSSRRTAIGWSTLGFIFLMLSLDEITQIHEGIGDYVENFIKADGVLYHVWVVPYILLVIVVAAIYLPFYVKLPSDVRTRFTAAGILYVGGAIGLEMVGSIEASTNGLETWYYTFLYSVEELCEMLGAVFFIDSAMVYLTRHSGPLSISILESSNDLSAEEKSIPNHTTPEFDPEILTLEARGTATPEDSYNHHRC